MSTLPREMTAAVLSRPGGPDALQLETLPVPEPQPGRVLIRVRARGLNRSELFTRRGQSPGVQLPRVLGIEAVGTVAACPGSEFQVGAKVATAMGGMGRRFDGSYAEFTSVPVDQVQRLETTLDWTTLGALPEMLQTAWGSLFTSLRLQPGQSLLIRGGTTSVGLAATVLAKRIADVVVAATTRNPDRAALLRENGCDHVFVDSGSIAAEVGRRFPDGFDRVLELVGTTTLEDSLVCAARHGMVCMTGMVGDRWDFAHFAPMESIPTTVGLTTYAGDASDFMRTPLQEFVDEIESGRTRVRVGATFGLHEIVEAHRTMETNSAGGKIVVLSE